MNKIVSCILTTKIKVCNFAIPKDCDNFGGYMPTNKKKNQKNNINKPKLKEKMAEVLELPKEIVLNIPKLTMVGNGGLIIENYKGVIEYEETKVRINTGVGVIKITGEGLIIKEITSENIMVDGKICSIEFTG